MTGTSSFGAAIDYIEREGPEHERDHEPLLAVWSENVATLETAALEMEAVASQSRAKEPHNHLIVSFAEGERPDVRAGGASPRNGESRAVRARDLTPPPTRAAAMYTRTAAAQAGDHNCGGMR